MGFIGAVWKVLNGVTAIAAWSCGSRATLWINPLAQVPTLWTSDT